MEVRLLGTSLKPTARLEKPTRERPKLLSLVLVETIWSAVSQEGDSFQSPAWPARALEETEPRPAEGMEHIEEWNEAKRPRAEREAPHSLRFMPRSPLGEALSVGDRHRWTSSSGSISVSPMRFPPLFLPLQLTAFAAAALAPGLIGSAFAVDLAPLGGKVRSEGGVPVELSCDTDAFTAAEYRLIGQCLTLKKLNLNGKTLTDETLPLLAGLTALEELTTNGSQLSDDGYRHFAAFPRLRVLHLWHPSFGKAGFTGSGLIHLKGLARLERLTFAGATAGDEALAAIGQLDQLRFFQTWHTAQTQAGNAHLVKLTRMTRLKIGQRLPRWGTDSAPSFDGSTIPVLARIASLEELELFEARLKFADLEPLGGLPNLKRLSIHTCDIAEADIARLRSALGDRVTVEFKPISPEDAVATLGKKLRL